MLNQDLPTQYKMLIQSVSDKLSEMAVMATVFKRKEALIRRAIGEIIIRYYSRDARTDRRPFEDIAAATRRAYRNSMETGGHEGLAQMSEDLLAMGMPETLVSVTAMDKCANLSANITKYEIEASILMSNEGFKLVAKSSEMDWPSPEGE
ncbi:MAG: hypothetical protein FWG74_07975 [Planctomycetes bacterium]|nr:hypothetical protein [Planctomycetota bacterium]